MSDSFFRISERIKDEVGGVTRKIGILDAWIQFQKAGGYPILPTHQFFLESLRNAHELAVLKMFHLLDANEGEDVSLLRLQTELERQVPIGASERDEVTKLGRELKNLRKKRDKLKEYRNRHVAHPAVQPPTAVQLSIIRGIASELFAIVGAYQKFMLGGLNYEAEVAEYRDSFLSVLHPMSVEAARIALERQS